ncbi:MAG: flagellar basal body rod protein FlgF [Novosphingobium sp.]|nr:flagellar basal body rod protein FlgF [Novosphingobium sp.]
MDRLIYTAVSGLSAAMARQRMIASNMANAQTIGFRAETMETLPMTLEGAPLEVRALAQGRVEGASLKEGPINRTGRDLDIALQGEVMLAVQAKDGAEAYTRRGDLSIAPSGLLQNGEGLPVIGTGGPVTVPLGTRVSIAPDGRVLAADPSQPDQPPVEVARIKLASTRGSVLRKGLDGLFRVPGGGVLPDDPGARVVPGALEGSNVSMSAVLVDMIETQRMFEMRSKLVSTARELDEGSARLMRIE